MSPPPPLKPDAASQANLQALHAQLGDSCSAPILEPERSALLQEALADSRLQAVKAQLEGRGLGMNADEAQAVQLVGGEQLLVPFGQDAHLVWTRTNGQTAAIGLVRQGQKTLNVGADGHERVVRFLSGQQAEKLLRKLREKSKFQDFEGKLHRKGQRVGQVRVLLDETNKIAIVGIAAEGSEKIAHQVRIKLKGDRHDEPEEDAEPVIQGTACGQASGEAVATSSAMQPLAAPPGEGGDFEGGYEGPQICTSQWGYDYLCFSTTPMLSLSTTSLTVPQTFINQQVQASFTIWNGGGGTLTGTVSAPAPFSIVSGASFSLLPGQPQEVVVRFSSATAGSFSKSVSISSNGGSKTVTATSVAHKVSFSPASVDFGSGLFVMREQCNDMGVCGLRTEKVGLPIEKQLTVKNEGSVSVTLTLSTAAPYKIVSVPPTLSPGQSGQVTVRFDPNESGTFTGTVQVGINGGQGSVSASPMTGVAHKIEVNPAELNFGIAFVGSTTEQKLTVKNQGVTTVSLTVSVSEPFSIVSEGSFTLAPSETREVAVRISPTASGTYIENLRLVSGLAVKEVPIVGMAYTFEEWVQAWLSAYNRTAQDNEAYGVVYNEGPSHDLLLAGFEQLDWSTINLWRNVADTLNPATSSSDPQLQEALGLLQSIDPAKLTEWLQQLKEAIQQGNFDEVYNQLLGQGMAQLQQALMLLLHTDTPVDARQLLFRVAQQPDPQIELIRNLIITLLTRFQAIFPMSYEDARAIADQFVSNLQAALGVLQPLLNELCSLFFGCGPLGSSPQGRDYLLTMMLTEIIGNIWESNDQKAVLDGCSDACQVLKQFSSLVAWIGGTGDAPTVIDPIQRRDVGFGTLLVAYFISTDSQYGFSIQGFLGPNGQPLSPNDPRAFLVTEGKVDDKRVVSVVRGDHCSTCDSPHNITDAVRFVHAAIDMIRERKLQGGTFPVGDYNVVALVFTRPGARGIDDIISALQADQFIQTSTVPVMVIWKDANGEINYKCANEACNKLPAKIKWALAQTLAGSKLMFMLLFIR